MRVRGTIGWWLAAGVVAGPVAGDEILLNGGGRVSGRIVERTATRVAIETGPGRVTLPMSRVLKIVESRSTIQEFDERAAELASSDVLGWTALARWAEERELFTQARLAWQRVLAQDPRNPAANAGLGRVELDGAWLSRDEAYRAQGYVWFEGQWLTPPEHEAALRERAAHETAVREARESDVRVREAEARAREAEARAREAEAAADQAYGDGIPLDYIWGAGPLLYPPYAGIHPGRPWPAKRGHRHGDLRPVPVPTPVPRPVTPPLPGSSPRRQQAGLATPSRR